jgi:hypothetical protein
MFVDRTRRFPAVLIAVLLVAGAVVVVQIARPERANAATAPVIERDWVGVSGTQPPASGAMAYDQARRQTVLLVPGDPSQTWVFNGASRQWAQVFPPTSPSLRNASAAYDAATGTVVAFGSDTEVSDCISSVEGVTWSWDGSTWTQLHPANAPDECSGLSSNPVAYDAARGQVVLIAGTTQQATWIWDGTNWSSSISAPQPGAAVAYDAVSKRVIAFGGTFYWHGDNDYGTTQAWNGTTWVTLDRGGGPKDPGARGFASMTFDPVLNCLVLFGGVSHYPGPHNLADTWRWSGAHWVRMGTRARPPAAAGSPFAYDTDDHVGVLLDRGTWFLTAGHAGGGYYEVMSNGGVFHFGDAEFHGGVGNQRLGQPVVGIARTPSRNGYWLTTAKGRVFRFGDARLYGDTAHVRLHRPIIAIVATPSGLGYWLVASDGGIFTFGDARYFGGTGNRHLGQPIVGMALTPSGGGYWLVAGDGGIFTFGDARFFGSAPQITPPIDRPVVGMAANPTGTGYWIVTRDGGVFFFGTPPSTFTNRSASGTIVAIASSPTGRGYWLFSNLGKVEAFGDAAPHGSVQRAIAHPVLAGIAT